MKNEFKNAFGFGTLEALLILLFIGIIGFGGWKVYESNNPAPTPPVSTTAPKTVESLATYENKELGFKVDFPEDWGRPKLSENHSEGGTSYTLEFNTEQSGYAESLKKNKTIRFYLDSEDFKDTGASDFGPRAINPAATKTGVLADIAKYNKDSSLGKQMVFLNKDAYILAKIDGTYGDNDSIEAGRVVSIPKINVTAIYGTLSTFIDNDKEDGCAIGELSKTDPIGRCITQEWANKFQSVLLSFDSVN